MPVLVANLCVTFGDLLLALSRQLLRPLILDGLHLHRRALLHLAPLPRGVLLAAHASVLLALLLDQSADCLCFLLFHEHLKLRHRALLSLLVGPMSSRLLLLLLLNNVQLRKASLALLIGLL